MGHRIVSLREAQRIVRQTNEHVVWVQERQAKLFDEPGWIELLPHRDGAVLFINRERERLAARAKAG
jgi:hypothetical protein